MYTELHEWILPLGYQTPGAGTIQVYLGDYSLP